MLNCKGLVFISMAGPSGHWALLLSFPLLDNTENLEDCGGGLFGTGGLVLLESTPPPLLSRYLHHMDMLALREQILQLKVCVPKVYFCVRSTHYAHIQQQMSCCSNVALFCRALKKDAVSIFNWHLAQGLQRNPHSFVHILLLIT